MIVDRDLFFKIQHKINNTPFNQTEQWLEGSSVGEFMYFADNVECPHICCWGRVFVRKFIGKQLMIDGLSVSPAILPTEINNFFSDIVSLRYSIIDVSDISDYDPNFEIQIRQAGFLRPLGLTLCPLTLHVNLQKPFVFKRNWSRLVRKAIKHGISFVVVKKPTLEELTIFVNLFNQLAVRKNLRFNINAINLLFLFKSDKYKLFFAKHNNGDFLSGRIIYISNDIAYDTYAANSDIALQYGAAYFLQEKILYFLKDLGVKKFDYGRISPSADNMNNIYLAKSYSGGEPIQYNGQWQYSKSQIIAFLYSFHSFFVNACRRF